MRTIPSVTEYSLCSLRWTNRGAFTKKFYREPVPHARVKTKMRRILLIIFSLAIALKQWRYDQARERWSALSARSS
jgi:hypothetical protein